MPNPANDRDFRVHARHIDCHHARLVSERSFEAAAVAYLEDLPLADETEVSVIVRDVGSGHEHCFRFDLETGETSACG